jgi:hypothetical protein
VIQVSRATNVVSLGLWLVGSVLIQGCAAQAIDDGPVPLGLSSCNSAIPRGATEAPDPPAYRGGQCPMLSVGTTMNKLLSSGIEREFLVVVPDDAKPDETFPVLFMWHWLNASASSFYDRAQMQTAANEARLIAVIPNGIGSIPANWPWSTITSADVMEQEFAFFDDMLACVSEQFPVNKNCVSSTGVSDGALWTAQLAGGRGEYLSSIVVLSGGTGTSIVNSYASPVHKMPALVLWGGPTDRCIVIEFEAASHDLEQGLVDDGHFLVECVHDCGHGEPPIDPVDGMSRFAPMWHFVTDHPYWLRDGESPYQENGLPAGMPNWCAIGIGNAVPRAEAGMGCGDIGC